MESWGKEERKDTNQSCCPEVVSVILKYRIQHICTNWHRYNITINPLNFQNHLLGADGKGTQGTISCAGGGKGTVRKASPSTPVQSPPHWPFSLFFFSSRFYYCKTTSMEQWREECLKFSLKIAGFSSFSGICEFLCTGNSPLVSGHQEKVTFAAQPPFWSTFLFSHSRSLQEGVTDSLAPHPGAARICLLAGSSLGNKWGSWLFLATQATPFPASALTLEVRFPFLLPRGTQVRRSGGLAGRVQPSPLSLPRATSPLPPLLLHVLLNGLRVLLSLLASPQMENGCKWENV